MATKETVLHVTEINDPALAHEIWEAYKGSFADTDKMCAQDQICYDEKTMTQALSDPDYQKFVLKVEDHVVGICILTNNLMKARIAYCNDRFLRRKFPKYVEEGRFWYVTAICVLPEAQQKGFGVELLRSVCQFIFDTKSMVSYDYSFNKNPWLTGLIQKVGASLGWNVVEIPLDKQCYTSLYYSHNGLPS
ncbi:MAG: GNAT family N-acetyltransferase [Candidatus Parcubacteria bacterium]|nr:GNAT family N-acetyltransferase [Candidatus Parcubacteria bacterium]